MNSTVKTKPGDKNVTKGKFLNITKWDSWAAMPNNIIDKGKFSNSQSKTNSRRVP